MKNFIVKFWDENFNTFHRLISGVNSEIEAHTKAKEIYGELITVVDSQEL